MGRVMYGMHASIDGYIEDRDGGIGFSKPAEDVHQAANDQARQAAAFLPVRSDLRLRPVEHRSFASGVVYVRYIRA